MHFVRRGIRLMKSGEVRTAELHELVAAYRDAARTHGERLESGSVRKCNRAADLLAAIYAELRFRGIEAQRALLALLTDPAPGVRGWAAAHALEFAPDVGEPVLIELSKLEGLVGFSAEEWRKGRLKFP